MGVGSILNPHVANIGRSYRCDVPTDWLFCHIICQAGAACTSGWRWPSKDQKRGRGFRYHWTQDSCMWIMLLLYFFLIRYILHCCASSTKTKEHNPPIASKSHTNPKTRVNLECANSRLRIGKLTFSGTCRSNSHTPTGYDARPKAHWLAIVFQWGDWKSCQPTEKHFNLCVNWDLSYCTDTIRKY